MLNVSFVCSSVEHPVFNQLNNWCAKNARKYNIELVQSSKELRERGDFLFLISCSEIITKSIRDKFRFNLVLHASDLPFGRGWSPHIWEVLNGADQITLSMLEVEDKIDSGKIWAKQKINLDGTELFSEINDKLFSAEFSLIEYALNHYDSISPKAQSESNASYYPKRCLDDSKIDIRKSFESQFNLLRVCDSDRFPAFFDHKGCRYAVRLEKLGANNDKQ